MDSPFETPTPPVETPVNPPEAPSIVADDTPVIPEWTPPTEDEWREQKQKNDRLMELIRESEQAVRMAQEALNAPRQEPQQQTKPKSIWDSTPALAKVPDEDREILDEYVEAKLRALGITPEVIRRIDGLEGAEMTRAMQADREAVRNEFGGVRVDAMHHDIMKLVNRHDRPLTYREAYSVVAVSHDRKVAQETARRQEQARLEKLKSRPTPITSAPAAKSTPPAASDDVTKRLAAASSGISDFLEKVSAEGGLF